MHSERNVPEGFGTRWNIDSVSDQPQTRAAIRRWTQLYEEAVGCAECGVRDHRCLLFHHEDRSEKRKGVSALIEEGYGFHDVRAEIEKCTVLCANCHRRVHLEPIGSERKR